jgi:hypothetical protein
MTETDIQSRIDCFNCSNTSFELKGIERLKGTNWQVLLKCPVCQYTITKRYSNFNFEYQLIDWLRRQKVIGNAHQKGHWLPRRREYFYYPYDPEIGNYDLSNPKKYKKNQYGN